MPEGERRLAAIMFTDMVGYTALTQSNESQAMEVLERHNRLLRPFFPKFHGREVKAIGDSFLVEFDSALDALKCAVEIQEYLHDYNTSSRDEWKIKLRIGIHLGDVIHQGGDVFGDAVNIASRIEPMAEAEGICVSDQVFGQVRNKISRPLVKLAPKDLKNVQFTIDVYKVMMPWEASSPTEIPNLPTNRIAVLPFANISPDPNDEYFADGLTEELIARLSLMKGLEVIARTSVMNYKKKEKNVTQIGKELNAGTLLEGSVRKAGNRIRVTTQLINSNTEGHLWAESYDRELGDIFAVQSSVAEKVADSLKLKLVDAEKQRIEAKGPRNSEAYVEHLRGLYFVRQASARDEEAGIRKSIRHFEKALELEPNYAATFAMLSICYRMLGYLAFEPMDKMYAKTEELASKALELDDTVAEAHYAIGIVGWFKEGNWEKAEKEFRRALELNPNFVDALIRYANFLSSLGRNAEAISGIEKALELDPLSGDARGAAGNICQHAKRYSEALSHFDKAREIDPDFGHNDLGNTLVLMGRTEEGVKELERALALSGGSPFFKGNLGYAYAVSGRREDALRLVDELKQASKRMQVSYSLAQVYAGLGEKEEALNCLEKAYEEHSLFTQPLFPIEPFLANLRQEPRFKELVRKVGLDKYLATQA